MSAGVYNIEDFEQGATYTLSVDISNIPEEFDLSAIVGASKIKRKAGDSQTIGEFTVTVLGVDEVERTASTKLTMSDDETALVPSGAFVYDYKITDGSMSIRILKGSICPSAQVTD